MTEQLVVAIPIYDRFTALDAVGPYEILQRPPTIDVVFVGSRTGTVRTENGMLGVVADATLSQVPSPDVVLVPGGIGSRSLLDDEELLEWIRTAHRTSRWTTSVCSGSLLLAAAGLLDDLTATTHWGAMSTLEKLGARPTNERVVVHESERIITAAGVSSGIDMALHLLSLLIDPLAAQAAQLLTEYDPQPPYDVGSLAKAPAEVVERATAYGVSRE